jgi:hypothetical protein
MSLQARGAVVRVGNIFLGSDGKHFRRSDYGVRLFRPAADGWYPRNGRKPAMPVLVDVGDGFRVLRCLHGQRRNQARCPRHPPAEDTSGW